MSTNSTRRLVGRERELARAPPLLVAEDAHWLDDPGCDVLAFVARRVETEPIVLLTATRDESARADGLNELRLGRLEESAASALLATAAPDLAPEVRSRLLREADGNPLALLELPGGLASERFAGHEELPEPQPLTTPLHDAFAARVAELPTDTRSLLVVAAADDRGVLREILGAAGAPAHALEPAVAARLVAVADERIRFRHPLVRSAVYQAAGSRCRA